MKLYKDYWAAKYRENKTGWDLGSVSPPLKQYMNQLKDKSLKILLPGAGNSYEAEYLFINGFKNIYVLDIAEDPLKNLKRRIPGFPEKNLIQADYFEFEGSFDLILEQTFFCAIPVQKRGLYAEKTHQLLRKNGKLVGLLFNSEFFKEGPPFGGSKKEYLTYFSPYFTIEVFEPCTNSILPRQGNELFFIFKKN
jgi:thiopurine S-methyltransferase